MNGDVEEVLTRELREVAADIRVPAMPELPREPVRRPWRPLLAAAAAVAVVAAGVSVATRGTGPGPTPTPSTQTPSATPSRATPSTVTIPRSAPSVPYVVDRSLHVDGERVPGEWWSVDGVDSGWLALRADNTWWWGYDAEPHEISGPHDTPPVISPGGEYVAYTTVESGKEIVTGFDTRPAGEGFGLPVGLGDRQDGSLVTVRAVTDDGQVVVQGSRTALLWQPLVVDGGDPVDLRQTAAGAQFLAATPAGVVATYGADSREGQPFLADLSEDGELTRTQSVPEYDSLLVSPGGAWLAWLPPGTLGGEVAAVRTLETQRTDGSDQGSLTAPDGWAFRVEQWTWEDDDYLVATVTPDGRSEAAGGDRMARCSPAAGRCALVPLR